jgi:hypothetical protein
MFSFPSLLPTRRTFGAGLVACSLLGAAAPLALFPRYVVAQEKVEGQSVPLKTVFIFNSGVGYFEHEGEVDGNATIELKFSVDDINDLLKSMVLQDLGGGKIAAVTYGSRDPITKTLGTFAIDLTNNPPLGDILIQARGQEVEVSAPDVIRGTILGVEIREKHVKDEVVQEEFLNLLTPEGLQSLPLTSIGRIKLLDEKLNAEFQQALAVLAGAKNVDKKTVTLDFAGAGKRPVRVGYIQETPVWKTSYRLVLDEKGKPFLQGWAIVENTSEEDWKNVKLTLVSGRPISYRMDLYEPLYAQRPLEQLELYASLRPQSYDQNLAANDAGGMMGGGMMGGGMIRGMGGAAAPGLSVGKQSSSERAMPAAAPAPALSADSQPHPFQAIDMSVAAAQGTDVGELFQYVIDLPVTLARQKSAMLPIVNESVEGEKVSIYNPSVQAKHPLNGLRLVNSTPLHLMQGPITVFDSGTYAGDAKIDDLAPGAERLLSYALDLSTEIALEPIAHPEQLVSVKINKGTLLVQRKYVRENKYTVKNSDDKGKKILIEQPLNGDWKLVTPKEPSEKTRDRYRFAVDVQPGESAKLEVTEELLAQETLLLTNLDDSTIEYYISQKQVSEEAKQALQDVIKRKQALAELVRSREQLNQKISSIDQEQQRIRQNMGQLDRNSELYRRYVQKFGEQESQIEKMRTEIETLTAKENKLRDELGQYLSDLTL